MVSLIDKIVLGLLLLLTLLVAGEGLYIHGQKIRLAAVKATNVSLEDSLDAATKTIAQQKVADEITNQAVTSTVQAVNDNNAVKQTLTNKVDQVAKQVANEQITSAVADAAYTSSMWSAYCKASPSDSACTTRQSTPSVPH